jgi:hypothetical protein
MSSYFDTMGQCLRDPRGISDLVQKQYRAYLRDLENDVVKEDEEKLYSFVNRFLNIVHERERSPDETIAMIHNLAHDLGRAGIRLKDGRRAGDNPNIPY